jgi:hypothetical protein
MKRKRIKTYGEDGAMLDLIGMMKLEMLSILS